jgi:hypothetical protein
MLINHDLNAAHPVHLVIDDARHVSHPLVGSLALVRYSNKPDENKNITRPRHPTACTQSRRVRSPCFAGSSRSLTCPVRFRPPALGAVLLTKRSLPAYLFRFLSTSCALKAVTEEDRLRKICALYSECEVM